MNTVEKGDKFEELSFKLISKAVNEMKLGIIPSQAKIFKQKGYYSNDRKGNIIFDLSIEIWPEGAKNYTLLYLIECKDYKIKIPVGRVEEFYGKIMQVAGVNAKGVFITKKGFQKGAYNVGEAKGMMLVQANSNLTLNIILHKTRKYQQEKVEKTIEIDKSNYDDPILREIINRRWKRKIDQTIIKSFLDFFLSDKESQKIEIPVLSSLEIEEFVNSILNVYDRGINEKGNVLNWKNFKEYLGNIFQLKFKVFDKIYFDSQKREIISSCSFSDKTIWIAPSLVNTSRVTFLIAHEIGHFFLHNKIALGQRKYEGFEDKHSSFEMKNERDWLEWQANQFAANLILPKKTLIYRFSLEQIRIGLKAGKKLYVDDQKCNQDDYHSITSKLAYHFNTSKTSVIYRLNSLDLIEYNFKVKSVGEIITNMLE